MPDATKFFTQSPRLTKNYILNALPEEDFKRMLPNLEKVNFEHGHIVYQPDDVIDYIYFPHHSMISDIATTANGESAEVGVIGWEGIVGVDVLLGANRSFNQKLVQLPDSAIRMRAAAALIEFKRAGAFHDLVLQFVHLLMIQISQTALCNRLHSVEERLARWLLLCHDRAEGDEIKLTQEFLAIMLGTSRATVTTSAIVLQAAEFIKYQRGRILMTDREGLEHFACACYRTVKDEYDRCQK